MWTENFQMFKLVLEKAEEPEIKLPVSAGSLKKQESSRKMFISALLTMPKPLTVWITRNCGEFWKSWEYQSTWPACWETWMHVRKQQLKLDMEQQTSSKQGKKYVKAVYCHMSLYIYIDIYIYMPIYCILYIVYCILPSPVIMGWMKHKLELRLPGKTSITSDMQMIPPLWKKVRETKEPLDKSERGEWKSWLKIQHSEN